MAMFQKTSKHPLHCRISAARSLGGIATIKSHRLLIPAKKWPALEF